MERAAFVRQSVHQTARAASVFRVVLQGFSPPDRFQDLVQADALFDHLLLCLLSDSKVPARCLGLDVEGQGFEFHGVRLAHQREWMTTRGLTGGSLGILEFQGGNQCFVVSRDWLPVFVEALDIAAYSQFNQSSEGR
jgi:hypothetical protein